ncbi:universal stress protein [Nocardia sp. NPDC003482]
MSSYRSIVVGIDGVTGSPHAVATAARLAFDTQALLTLVGAYPRLAGHDRAEISDLLGPDIYSVLPGASLDELLEFLACGIRDRGVDRVVPHSERGAPATNLLHVADFVDADLIVVGRKDFDTPWRRLGSFQSEVARRADRDLLIVAPQHRAEPAPEA